jgi:hypothetical protein
MKPAPSLVLNLLTSRPKLAKPASEAVELRAKGEDRKHRWRVKHDKRSRLTLSTRQECLEFFIREDRLPFFVPRVHCLFESPQKILSEVVECWCGPAALVEALVEMGSD